MKGIEQKSTAEKIAWIITLISILGYITLKLGFWFGRTLYHLGF